MPGQLIGQQWGNYRLMRLLGRGGFAEVYLGEHVQLATPAAIKILHAQLGEDSISGFQREAQIIAELEHPHIIRLLDYDVREEQPFLVLAYAPNGSLRQQYSKGTHLPLSLIIRYTKQIADALQFAHDRHLIHRDVKPDNLLVGNQGQILLSDFGIVAVAHSTSSMNTQNSMGTLAYMAPEQMTGHSRPQSDQYALGIVVYQWLSGELPFHGSPPELIARHFSMQPPSLRAKIPDLPEEVEEIVMRALAKESKDRFPTIRAFATALEEASPEARGEAPFVTTPQPSIRAPVSLSAQHHLLQQGRPLHTYKGHSGAVRDVNWSQESTLLVSGGDDGSVRIWDMASERVLTTYQRHQTKVRAATWLTQETLPTLISASYEGSIHIWHANSDNPLLTLQAENPLQSIAWAPDRRLFVTASHNVVQVWHIQGQVMARYSSQIPDILTLVWSPDGKYIAAAGTSGMTQIWQIGHWFDPSAFNEHTWVVRGSSQSTIHILAWSPKGEKIASGGEDGSIDVWNPRTTRYLKNYASHEGPIYALAWSPDEMRIASAGADRAIHIWGASPKRPLYSCIGHATTIFAVAWSPNGTFIASAGADKTVRVWSALSP